MRYPFRTLGFKTTPARTMELRSLTVPHQQYFPFSFLVLCSCFCPSTFSTLLFFILVSFLHGSLFLLSASCIFPCRRPMCTQLASVPICRRGASPSSHSCFLLFIFSSFLVVSSASSLPLSTPSYDS